MQITDMVGAFSTGMMNEHLKNIKNDTEKYDKTLQMLLPATEVEIIFLKESYDSNRFKITIVASIFFSTFYWYRLFFVLFFWGVSP